MKRLGVLVILLVLSASSSAADDRAIMIQTQDAATGETATVPLYRKMVAVVIGIDRYKNLPVHQQLRYAVRDAEGVAAVLSDNYSFDTVVTLFDEDATRAGILQLLQGEVAARVGPDDAVFFFFAGHGITHQTGKYGPLGFIVPHDGSFDDKLSWRNISMEYFKNEISRQIAARHVFYVIDACYSGLLLETRGAVDPPKRNLEYLRELTREDARQVLTAGTDKQPVLDGGPRGHSVFTGRLIEKLESVDDYITAKELSTWISERVYHDAVARGHVQRPVSGPLWGLGDFVFVPRSTSGVPRNTLAPVASAPIASEPPRAPAPVAPAPAAASRLPAPRKAPARSVFIGRPDATWTTPLEPPE